MFRRRSRYPDNFLVKILNYFSGIFHNDAENFFVWVNEEDQMRIVSMQKGDAVVEIFKRFAKATKGIQEVKTSSSY